MYPGPAELLEAFQFALVFTISFAFGCAVLFALASAIEYLVRIVKRTTRGKAA